VSKIGMAGCKLTTAEVDDITLIISSPQVMLLGNPRFWKRANVLARIVQSLITVYRPSQRTDILGMPDTWEVLRGLDATETTFTATQLSERMNELGLDVSVRSIAGLLGTIVRRGGSVFVAVGYPTLAHIDTAMPRYRAARQSLEAGLVFLSITRNDDQYTMQIVPRFRGDWSQNRSINEFIVEQYEDELPDAMRDIIDHTCIPNGPQWITNHFEGYRRWE